MRESTDKHEAGATVGVIGLGVTGSQVLGHVARNPVVKHIICVDGDVYSEGNVSVQEITRRDINMPKAAAAARRVRAIRGDIEVIPIVVRVEDVPWGRLRANVLLGCVDSKAARAAISRIAWTLGIPYIDSGVRGDGLLARVDVYMPGPDTPCVACAWNQQDYDSLSQVYSCTGERREAPATRASSALGGLAAALQALECAKVLQGEVQDSVGGRQVVIEARSHHVYVNTLRRNPACRFDHRTGPIHKAAGSTLGELVAAGAEIMGHAPAALSVEAKSWVTRLACIECGAQTPILVLQGRISSRQARCPKCGNQRKPVGFSMLPRLDLAAPHSQLRRRRLSRLGLGSGDVVTLSNEHGQSWIELTGDAPERQGQ